MNNDSWAEDRNTFNYKIACQCAVRKITLSGKTVYLMTFPDSRDVTNSAGTTRQRTTLWISYDSKTWIRCFRLDSHVNLGYCCMDYYDGKLIAAFEHTTGLDIAFEDLTPLLSNFIIGSTQYEINKPSEDKVQELLDRVLALEATQNE